jgi:TonB-linked SusC/RagA family outer membrane protein
MDVTYKNIARVLGLSLLPFITTAQTPEPTITVDTTINAISTVPVLFGEQRRDQVTAAISRVSSADMRKSHTATIGNTLFGRLPGVAVMQSVNTPGFDDATIYIRGRQTFQNNGFLVLLDGFPINKFSQLSTDEIESVTVLKDAAALAMYGIKAANGALLITTKRGKYSNKINIAFNARYGYQQPTQLPKMVGSYDFARLYNEALANDGLPALYTQKDLDGYQSGANPYLYPNVNWYNEALRKGSGLQNYSLSFNGGNSNARYFLMMGFMNNQGLYAHTDQEHNANIGYQQINFRANVDLNITKRLSAQIGLGGDIEDRKFPPVSTESMWQNMAIYAPNLYSVRTPEGNITGTPTFPNNPLGDLLEKGFQSRHDRTVQATLKLNEKLDFITPGLNLFGTVFFNSEFNSRYDKTRSNAYYEPIRTKSSTGEDSLYYLQRGIGTDLAISVGNNVENNRVTFMGGFDYKRTIDEHEIGALVMYFQDKYSNLGDQSAFAMQNLAGRLTWGYKQRYFGEVGFSYSGTENYAPGKRFGFFPAVSAGWLLHKENFWQPNNAITYLKFRASAGIMGNDRAPSALSRFPYTQYWGTQSNQGYYFGTGQTFYNALVQLRIANPDMTWEKAIMYNAGIESKWLKDKLTFNTEVFYQDRNDILVDMSGVVPSLSGVSQQIYENKGKVNSYGAEVEVQYNDKAGQLTYFTGAQFSFARNTIKENFESPKKEDYSVRKDHPISQNFGLEAIGYFRDESDILSSPVQTFSVVRPGDLKYKDQNKDGVIDVNDEIAIGTHSYPEIIYSFTGGLAWKGFDLDFLFQGSSNRTVNLNNYLFQPFINNANISEWAAEGHWTPQNHADAKFPRLTTLSSANNYRASTFWLRNVTQLRLRNVELGYTLNRTIIPRMPFESLRIYVSGLNLVSWDNLEPDVDTETMGLGYPPLKVLTVGLSLKL